MSKKLNKVFLGLLTVVASASCAMTDSAFKKVSKQESLGNYEPNDLVSLPAELCTKPVQVSARIVPDLKKLIAAAAQDGITLKVNSGYRSHKKQVHTFNYWVSQELKKDPSLTKKQAQERANTYSARAGHSEHQLGTVVDILTSENNYQFSSDRKLKYIAWLEQNTPRFHFTISFKDGNKEFVYEPWHIRWFPS